MLGVADRELINHLGGVQCLSPSLSQFDNKGRRSSARRKPRCYITTYDDVVSRTADSRFRSLHPKRLAAMDTIRCRP